MRLDTGEKVLVFGGAAIVALLLALGIYAAIHDCDDGYYSHCTLWVPVYTGKGSYVTHCASYEERPCE